MTNWPSCRIIHCSTTKTDPKLRDVYVQSLERSWQVERRNATRSGISSTPWEVAQEFDRDEAILTLQRNPDGSNLGTVPIHTGWMFDGYFE